LWAKKKYEFRRRYLIVIEGDEKYVVPKENPPSAWEKTSVVHEPASLGVSKAVDVESEGKGMS